ncbi:MAG: cadherin-like domain-containing protein [Betaproteobacteria bacterium]|nr:cadherin-like domain-containing protein [Betaproteobacteria bacterium]
MKPRNLKLMAVMASLAYSLSAHAVLERVGPPSNAPSIGGYPAWYQDTSGLALEFCDPKNPAELSGGWCLVLGADVPQVPEVFPTAYSEEHFYFAADAGVPLAAGSSASLTLALEATFSGAVPTPGEQITFARIRVKIGNVPVTGTYRFIHPYGIEVVEATAGERLFYTVDAGTVNCAGNQFECAMNGRLGPFLLPSATPGGAELPAVAGPVAGKLYLADPGRSGPVTGSALPEFTDSTGALRNHNIFRVEGPPGSNIGGLGIDFVETTAFSLQGRLYTGGMPGRVDVERASYARDAAGTTLDVFASAVPTTQGRLPTQPKPAAVQPQLSFYDAPCAGVTDAFGVVRPPYSAPLGAAESLMFAGAGYHWGQTKPAAIPAAVCVKDSSARDTAGNLVPAFYPRQVTDQIAISQALYDPSAATLSVAASSSDATVPPTLSVAFGTYAGDLVSGKLVVPVGFAPPDSIRVLSSGFGVNEARVTIGAGTGAPAPVGLPVALNDTFSFPEDSGAQILAVLSNDTNVAGGTLTLTSLPRFGSAVVNADGTVSYTANANASGADAFTYTVAVGPTVSNTGNVSLSIAPVNDLPVAVNDTVNGLANIPLAINVLANDTDADGAADLVAAANVSLPTPAGATATVAGGIVTFNASAAGTYTFNYQAQDATGALSANTGTVTVQVAAAETLRVNDARFVLRQNRIRVSGSISPAANQTVTVDYMNAAGTVLGNAGSTTALPDGTWDLQRVGVPVPPTGTTAVRATSSNGTVSLSTPIKIN